MGTSPVTSERSWCQDSAVMPSHTDIHLTEWLLRFPLHTLNETQQCLQCFQLPNHPLLTLQVSSTLSEWSGLFCCRSTSRYHCLSGSPTKLQCACLLVPLKWVRTSKKAGTLAGIHKEPSSVVLKWILGFTAHLGDRDKGEDWWDRTTASLNLLGIKLTESMR